MIGKIADTKESWTAQDFLKEAKGAFAEKLPRNKILDIGVTECVPDETVTTPVRMKITGSVETTSPTGKPRTYLYHAKVDVEGKKATLAELEIKPIEG
ncbi:MAG: hypothetical protein II776_04870 [Clostridia bacterium]|nr:hypothetical protein [Clostridia bacterium]